MVVAIVVVIVGSRLILQPIFDERPAYWTNTKGFKTKTALMQPFVPVAFMLREIRLSRPLSSQVHLGECQCTNMRLRRDKMRRHISEEEMQVRCKGCVAFPCMEVK